MGWRGIIQDCQPTIGPFLTTLQFEPDGHGNGQWVEPGLTPDSAFASLTRTLQAATVTKGDTWYALGGYADDHSEYPEYDHTGQFSIDGITSFNSTSGLWTTQSAENFSPMNTTISSKMENVPFGGPQGLNIILGGGIPPTQNFSSDNVREYLVSTGCTYMIL